MKANEINIMIDVHRAPGRHTGDALVSEPGGIHGVCRARVSPHVSRVVRVDFDPGLADSQTIPGAVAHRGFDARLVGMQAATASRSADAL